MKSKQSSYVHLSCSQRASKGVSICFEDLNAVPVSAFQDVRISALFLHICFHLNPLNIPVAREDVNMTKPYVDVKYSTHVCTQCRTGFFWNISNIF